MKPRRASPEAVEHETHNDPKADHETQKDTAVRPIPNHGCETYGTELEVTREKQNRIDVCLEINLVMKHRPPPSRYNGILTHFAICVVFGIKRMNVDFLRINITSSEINFVQLQVRIKRLLPDNPTSQKER